MKAFGTAGGRGDPREWDARRDGGRCEDDGSGDGAPEQHVALDTDAVCQRELEDERASDGERLCVVASG